MNNNLSKITEINTISMQISNISTGFIEIPSQTSLNIYVQGCKKRCTGCQNPELQSFDGGTTIKLEDLPNILKNKDLSTWICWLGGDAVYQEEGFLAFNTFFKKNGYKICLYTGKLFSEIENLLENVDIVVDGEWRGKTINDESTNQCIYIKTNNKWNKISYIKLKERVV